MKRLVRRGTTLAAVLTLGVFVTACGGSDDKKSSGGGGGTTAAAGQPGGKVTVLSAGDVDFIDPGQAYYAFSYMVDYAMMRPLYSFKPGDIKHPQNDLASAPPALSADGKTITITIRPGVRFAPPVDRAVKSADVKYAIERAFSANVPNAYAFNYFATIAGAPTKPTDGVKPIAGIETPDDTTLVLKLTSKDSATVIAALVMPITMPVPEEYAKPFDAKNPSTYDQYVVASGPYMIRNDAKGKLVGRQPGKSIDMIRNPNWDAKTDYRPALLDEIFVDEGNQDATVASRRILNGTSLIQGDGAPPAPVLKQAVQRFPDQLAFTPALGTRYVALNTTVPPFDDINVRKAVNAVFDRTAMRLTRGGASVGDIAWSYIPPGFPGFDESGGMKAPAEFDFLQNPDGDPQLAAEYMKKAGYPSGKYTGSQKLLMAASNASPGQQSAQVAQAQFEKLGFKLNFRVVPLDALYTKFCGTPKAQVAICPNVGVSADFIDGEALIKPYFYGPSILPANNTNWPQLNDPAIDKAIEAASQLPPGEQRVTAWANVNKQIVGSAAAIPWVWDKQPLVRSKNVQSQGNAYTSAWDLSFTSLTTR